VQGVYVSAMKHPVGPVPLVTPAFVTVLRVTAALPPQSEAAAPVCSSSYSCSYSYSFSICIVYTVREMRADVARTRNISYTKALPRLTTR
jgi:hypothetical protein